MKWSFRLERGLNEYESENRLFIVIDRYIIDDQPYNCFHLEKYFNITPVEYDSMLLGIEELYPVRNIHLQWDFLYNTSVHYALSNYLS